MRNKFENYELQGSIKTYEKKEITQKGYKGKRHRRELWASQGLGRKVIL